MDRCGSCGAGSGRLSDFQKLRISTNYSAANADINPHHSTDGSSARASRDRE
jgi:hypothetical protein